MRKMLLIDYELCTGCRMCVMACSFTKTNTFNPARSRIGIVKWEEEALRIPIMCQHCEEAPCIACCPVDAISKNEETGLVEINSQVCIGCKMCMMICPFGGPSYEPVEKRVVNCDLCGGNPACVEVCPTEALQYVKADRTAAIRRRGAMERLKKSITALGRA